MALVLKDRVLETASAPGTGTVTLLGATAGYQTFSAAIGNANTTYYTIADQSGSNWEVGIGTYTTSGNTLTRDTVLSSSNGGSLVNFNAGTQNVFVTYPAEEAIYNNGTSIVGPTGSSVAVANGGTGATTLTANGVVYGKGTSAVGVTAVGSTGQVLVGNTGAAPSWATVSSSLVSSFSAGTTGLTPSTATTGAVTLAGTLGVANGGTGATSAPEAMADLMGFTSTATAAGTTTLTNASSYYQLFTGSTTQTVVLPVTSTLSQGWSYHIVNNSTGALTVNSSGGNLVISVIAGTTAMVTCILTSGTTAASWESGYTDFSTATGTASVVLSTAPTITTLTAAGALTASATTQAINLGASQTSGTLILGGTAGTGTMTIGRSTGNQTTNIQAGATASGSTKTMNIATAGLSGSTTNINIGSAVVGAVTNIEVDGVFNVGSGIVCNSNAINDNYIIPTGSSGSSVGPVTVASGKTVTIPSGSRWVVL